MLKVWGFIPARGGSKSIKLKNLANLNGLPLMDYCVKAAQSSACCDRIICSTDHRDIADRAATLGIEVDMRPEDLGGDEVTTRDVIIEFLNRQDTDLPDILCVIEPTSPFLRVNDIQRLIKQMESDAETVSGQTLVQPPHTHHAWNQRKITENRCDFIFEERKTIYRKQDKPELWVFGNLVVCRVKALLAGKNVFDSPSAAVKIEWPYDVNIDHKNDLIMANALLGAGVVNLPHM
jgi:CMP-N,N'-diacetyllegionaminic acid synthase